MGFAADLSRLCERAGDRADLVVRKIALDLGRSMVLRSPVDTGRFRGNWQYGAGSPNLSTDNAPDRSGGGSVAMIAAGVASWTPGQTINITNALPYAVKLENGWSKQAPAGMVGLTVAEFASSVQVATGETP